MTDDEKTAESAAGLIPEPGELRDPIEQIRQMHAEVHSVHPADPAECNCSKCALLAEIDRLQAQLGAVVEECIRAAREVAIPYPDIEHRLRSLHPSATKALAKRVLGARLGTMNEVEVIWTREGRDSWKFINVFDAKRRELETQLAALDNQNEQKP